MHCLPDSSLSPQSQAIRSERRRSRIRTIQVFQIGKFDRSSIQFAQTEPAQPVRFVVGKSDPAKDWYAVQPAELPESPGSKSEARRSRGGARDPIVLTVADSQVGLPIHLALLVENPSVPVLSVEINGKRGRFYLRPILDSNMGDIYDAFHPSYSHADVTFVFPGSYLHAGNNTISLQAIEESVVSVLTQD